MKKKNRIKNRTLELRGVIELEARDVQPRPDRPRGPLA